MRKRLSYLLVVAVFVSMLSLSGCGGGGGTTKSEANPYEGKWVAVVAEAMGVQMPIEECFELTLVGDRHEGAEWDYLIKNTVIFVGRKSDYLATANWMMATCVRNVPKNYHHGLRNAGTVR
ncbi:MAG: hypothetical protein ACLRHK_10660 [Coprococcus sp.]